MNSVWYNDWRQVDVVPLDAFTPTRPVSVVVPYYQTHSPGEVGSFLKWLAGSVWRRVVERPR